MNSGGGSAPQFNASQTAQQQTAANAQTAMANAALNNTNQRTPYGNLTYNKIGAETLADGTVVPRYEAVTTLSPEQQKLYESQTGLQQGALDLAKTQIGRVGDTLSTPLSYDNAPKMPGSQDELRQQAYDASMSRARTDLDRSREAQKVQLANQGIVEGSEAWRRAMEGQDRALVDASNQATLNAGNIAGQNLQQAQTLRNQSINETTALRNQPIADYQALLGMGGSVTNPQFVTTPQIQMANTDVTTPAMAAYQGQMNAWNQQQQANQAMMGGLFGLGGAALGGFARNGFSFGRSG